MRSSQCILLSLFTITLLGLTSFAQAEDSRDIALVSKEPNFKHRLYGHYFLPSFAVLPAFTNTHATLQLLTGTGTYDAVVSGTPQELKLAAFNPTIEGQVNLIPKLALDLFIAGNFTAGINAPAAVLYGASVLYSLSAGLLYSPIETDQSTFSVGLQVNRPHLFAISPAASALSNYKEYVDAGSINFNNQYVSTQWTPTLRYAYAFYPWIGLQTALAFRIASLSRTASNESATQSSMSLALSVGTNMNTLINIPIGLSVSYLRNQVLSANQTNSNVFSFGIYETVWPNVNIGGEFGISTLAGVTTYLGGVQTRIYYN